VSTILKALEELEQRAPTAAPPAAASSKYEQVARAWSLTPLLLVLTAGSLVGMVYFAVRSAAKSASSPSVRAEPQRVSERTAADPLPLAAPARDDAPRAAVEAAPPARERVAAEEAPWGRVEKGSTIASAAAPPAPPASRAIVEPPAVPPREPSDGREESSRQEGPLRREVPLRREAAVRPPRQESPAGPADRKPSSGTSGGAEIEVMSIAYSENVGARSAALRIGGQAMTLRQGDSARGIEVQLILPTSVYLRRGRDIFAVDAKH